jgi:hypothetical protein
MPVAIAAAENKANQALALVSDLSATVDGLQMQPASQPRKRQRFGMFWDTTTQTAAAINTAYAVTYNSPSGDPYWSNVALLLLSTAPEMRFLWQTAAPSIWQTAILQ